MSDLTAFDRAEMIRRALQTCPDPLSDFDAVVNHLHFCGLSWSENRAEIERQLSMRPSAAPQPRTDLEKAIGAYRAARSRHDDKGAGIAAERAKKLRTDALLREVEKRRSA